MPRKKSPDAAQKTFRLPLVLAHKIEWLAERRETTEVEIVKVALDSYIDDAIRRFAESAEAMERLKKTATEK